MVEALARQIVRCRRRWKLHKRRSGRRAQYWIGDIPSYLQSTSACTFSALVAAFATVCRLHISTVEMGSMATREIRFGWAASGIATGHCRSNGPDDEQENRAERRKNLHLLSEAAVDD